MTKLPINWVQKAWYSIKGKTEKKPYVWEGKRSDNRTFKIIYIPHQAPKPFVCVTFNGQRLGAGGTLAEAQAFADKAPQVAKTSGKVSEVDGL